MSYASLLLSKIYKNKLNIIPFVLIVIFIVVLYVGNHMSAYAELNDPLYSGEQEIKEIETDITKFQKEITNYETSTQEYQITNDNLMIAKQRKKLLEQKLEAVHKKDWKEYYKNDMALNQIALKAVESDAESYGEEVISSLKQKQLFNQHMLNYGLGYDDRFAATQGISYMLQVTKDFMPILMEILIIFIVSSIYCSCFKNNLNIHQLIPNSCLNKQTVRFITGTLIGVLIVLLIELIAYVCGLIGNSSGNLNTPVYIYSLEGIGTYKALIGFIPQLGFLIVLSVAFIVNVISIISTFVKRNMTCLIISFIIIVGTTLAITEIVPLHSFAHIFPMTYLNFYKVITGELTSITSNTNISFLTGVIVLMISNIVLFVLSYTLSQYQTKKGAKLV